MQRKGVQRKEWGYRIATGVFCAMLGFSGFAHFTRVEMIVEAMTKLGYPLYFMTIIGAAKLLGVAALLAPGRPLMKEWAYAGFTFNLIGATVSHMAAGDPLSEAVGPAAMLVVGAVSYLLRPAERRLAVVPTFASESVVAPGSPSSEVGAASAV